MLSSVTKVAMPNFIPDASSVAAGAGRPLSKGENMVPIQRSRRFQPAGVMLEGAEIA